MKPCESYQEWISMMLDGELGESEKAELNSHMDSCPECRDMYEAFAAVSGAVAAGMAEVPAHLHETIMAGVKAASAPAKKRGLLIKLRPYMSAAACMVVIVGLLAMFRNDFKADNFARTMTESAPAAAADAAPAEQPEMYVHTTQSMYDKTKGEPSIVADDAMCDTAAAPAAPEAPVAAPVPMPEAGEQSVWNAELLSARIVIDGVEKEVSDPYALREMLNVVADNGELNVADVAEATGKVMFETVDGMVEISLWFTDEQVFVESNWGDPETSVYMAMCNPEELRALE